MPLNAIHNIRGFFSDYWLGSILSAKKSAGPRLTAAQARKKLWRLSQLYERVDSVEPSEITRFREKFARPLLDEIFGFQLLESDDARLRRIASNGTPLGAIMLCPNDDDLSSRQPRQNLERLLLDRNLPYGFIITPGTIRLIRKPGDGVAKAAFDFAIATAVETNDIESVTAAYRVLSAANFISTNGAPAPIELLEQESRKHSARVSEDLKEAVFVSAELLIRGFLQDISTWTDWPQPSLIELRDTALQTLYRLLFILYAESRDERLQSHTLYLDSYSLERLLDRLLQTREEEVPGNRFEFWAQLLALFEIYDKGMLDIPGLENIPPRGGVLFSSETPQGALIVQLRLNDRTIYKLLITLATTRPRRGVGRERVSFRELAIEQLGAVYEGLLEYEPRIASETMIEVRVQGREFVLAPAEVVRLCQQKELELKGDLAIVAGTAAAELHADATDEDQGEDDEEDEEDQEAEEEEKGLKRGAAARLIRRLETGDFYFVLGSARKASGSFYTREEIVQYLTRNALAGLVEGKIPAEIESLRIIDIACGSAHFLVGAARCLGAALLAAYRGAYKGEPPPEFYPDLELGLKVREQWEREAEAWCRRRIVEKCLFGVDFNPIAVQLAQVALWIESLAGDRPLSFFQHHIRYGNSLLGTWIDKLDTPPHPGLGERRGREHGGLFEQNIKKLIAQAIGERRLIDAPLPPGIRKDTPEEFEYKADRLERAGAIVTQARMLFDLRSASAFLPAIWRDWATLLSHEDIQEYAKLRPWWPEFLAVRERERFFHWELEFPEVFFGKRRGFDVVLGNPPWDKVLPARSEFYGRKDILIRAYSGNELDARIRELHAVTPTLEAEFEQYQERTKSLATILRRGGDFPLSRGRTAAAHDDLSKFFFERAIKITRESGSIGLLLPSLVYNGDGCVGLRDWLLTNASIRSFYGFENRLKIFPIHASYKFVCLVFQKAAPTGNGFRAAFMRHDLAELSQPGPHPWEVEISAPDVRNLSPESFAFLEYRGPRDQEIVRKMYSCSVRLGDSCDGAWGTTLISWRAHEAVFNASEDKDLWTDPVTGRLYEPAVLLGSVPRDPSALIEEMNRRGFFPVYEGKHIEQFIYGTKPIRWWLNVERARKKYTGAAPNEPVLVLRETASNTNQRTCIAAILPPGSAAAHTLTAVKTSHLDPSAAATVFNSLAFDFALRLRTAGTHISFTYMEPMPVPPGALTDALPRISTINASKEGCQFITDRRDLWPEVWQTNRAVAEAYGLSADDFGHILASFPSFARKRPEFYAFLIEQVRQWTAEALSCKK
jgi:hypothetical protein